MKRYKCKKCGVYLDPPMLGVGQSKCSEEAGDDGEIQCPKGKCYSAMMESPERSERSMTIPEPKLKREKTPRDTD